MASQNNTASERIRTLNDQFRSELGTSENIPGMVASTASIAALPDDQKALVLARVSSFDDFTPDNDPYGEHDFGAVEIEGIGRIFFKIDYYADESMSFGAEDPSDPTQSFRVLMIMFAHEY